MQRTYRETLKTHHLDTFRNYLIENPNFGNFGIILSRQGASRPCQRHIAEAIHSTHIRPPLTIIVLNEEDLLTMLDLAVVNASPLDVIEAKHKELLLAR